MNPETGELENKAETEKNLQYWMGAGKEQELNEGRGSGEASELHDQLDGYIVSTFTECITSQVKSDSMKVDVQDELLPKTYTGTGW